MLNIKYVEKKIGECVYGVKEKKSGKIVKIIKVGLNFIFKSIV